MTPISAAGELTQQDVKIGYESLFGIYESAFINDYRITINACQYFQGNRQCHQGIVDANGSATQAAARFAGHQDWQRHFDRRLVAGN